jgi:hypothetical protein
VPLNDPADGVPQVTPAFFESFATVAVRVDVCPWSIVAGAAVTVTAIGALDELQPTRKMARVVRRIAATIRTGEGMFIDLAVTLIVLLTLYRRY